MLLKDFMESRDTVGVGVAGIVVAFVTTTHPILMVATAFAVAAASFLGGYITKILVTYLEGLAKSWWKNRKTKVTSNTEE